MQYKKLAGTELTVSRVCLGTMTFGNQTDERTAAEAVAFAVDQGVNFIDTADIYPPGRAGETERILGRVMALCRKKNSGRCGRTSPASDLPITDKKLTPHLCFGQRRGVFYC